MCYVITQSLHRIYVTEGETWNYDVLHGFLTLKEVTFQNMGTMGLNLSHSFDKVMYPIPPHI